MSNPAQQIVSKAWNFAHVLRDDGLAEIIRPVPGVDVRHQLVEERPGEVGELSSQSEMVHELTKRYTLVRYYCPADLRVEIEAIVERVR